MSVGVCHGVTAQAQHAAAAQSRFGRGELPHAWAAAAGTFWKWGVVTAQAAMFAYMLTRWPALGIINIALVRKALMRANMYPAVGLWQKKLNSTAKRCRSSAIVLLAVPFGPHRQSMATRRLAVVCSRRACRMCGRDLLAGESSAPQRSWTVNNVAQLRLACLWRCGPGCAQHGYSSRLPRRRERKVPGRGGTFREHSPGALRLGRQLPHHAGCPSYALAVSAGRDDVRTSFAPPATCIAAVVLTVVSSPYSLCRTSA